MRSRMRGAGLRTAGLALMAGGTIAACAVNPATGDRQLMFLGQDDEIAMGQAADPQIVAQMGLHPDSALQRYVRGIGLDLAATSEIPDLPWTVRLLDDPTINAFAVPGGFVYVTRGIIANMTSEAQLAGVLGHEIGHVTARHGANQMSRQQLFGIGLIAGAIASETVAENFGLFSAGVGIVGLKYGRDDELQADRLGIRYMNYLGYEPRELAGVMAMLSQSSTLQPGGRATPEWLSTHPDPGNRIEEIRDEIQALDIPEGGIVRDDAFVRRLDGMVYGIDPREGFVEDGTFHHPELRFRFDVPRDWQLMNSKQAVAMLSDQGQIVMTLVAESADAALREFAGQEGVTMGSTNGNPIHGNPAATGIFSADSEGTQLWGRITFIEYGGNTYRLLGLTTWANRSSLGPAISASIESFREETDPAMLNRQPDRIEVVQLSESMNFSTFMARYPSVVEAPRVALMNQVSTEGRVGPGAVKRVIN